MSPPAPDAARAPASRCTASHVLAALAERLPRDAVVVEEAPVDRPELHDRLPPASRSGFLSAAMGGLGFAVAGAAGRAAWRCPERPVVAVVGDGSSIYGIQGLWSAAHYGAGVLYVILSNGGYAIMDRLAERTASDGAVAGLRRGRHRRARARLRLRGAPDRDARRAHAPRSTRSLPTLASRAEPLLLDVAIAPTLTSRPEDGGRRAGALRRSMTAL